jgi:hypothetical protein
VRILTDSHRDCHLTDNNLQPVSRKRGGGTPLSWRGGMGRRSAAFVAWRHGLLVEAGKRRMDGCRGGLFAFEPRMKHGSARMTMI